MKVEKGEYFSRSELVCPCGCDLALMDRDFIGKLDTLREVFDKPIILNSAYRCPEYNDAVSHTGMDGPHTTGKVVDIAVFGNEAHELLALIMNIYFLGIGISQKGARKNRFIHIDDLETKTRPCLWTY